ncbi:creatininase family protein, partial [Mycobacterium kansasii]
STATFAAVLTEYVDSLAHHGFRRFLLVNGHGGNNAVLGTTAQDLLRTHPDVELAWVGVSALAKDAVARLGVSEVHGH